MEKIKETVSVFLLITFFPVSLIGAGMLGYALESEDVIRQSICFGLLLIGLIEFVAFMVINMEGVE